MSLILNEVWREEESVCMNTEEMLAEFKRLNDDQISEDIIIGSADVKALYPSLDIPFAVDKACEAFYDSTVKVVGVDTEELGLYLSLNKTEKQLNELGLLPYCPTRKKRRGRPPVITGCAQSECKGKRFGPWQVPAQEPDEQMTRRMLTEGMKIVILFIMENHVYAFDKEIKLQSRGGPIGLQLTGVLAQLFMVWWDKQLERKMDEIGLKLWMYKRYVDDVNTVMSAPTPGMRFDGEKLTRDEDTTEADRNMEADERAMRLFRAVANSIHPSIEMEVDCSSRHEDRKLPILDLKVWIERCGTRSVILHEFYSKEVASKLVINARSALAWRSKRTILTQEVLRILLNCSTKLPWEVTVGHVNNMVLRMQYSGYNQKFRTEVIESALKAYDKIKRRDAKGEQPMYRPREWQRKERAKEKREKQETWYRKGGNVSVIFVPATPQSALRHKYEEEIRKVGLNIKVVERSGVTIKNQLQRSNPFGGKRCQRDECMVCRSDGKGKCSSTGVTYELVCQECKDQYIGETSRSAYSRGKEHLQAMEREEEGSVLRRHADEKHKGKLPQFTMNVTGVFRNDALLRQITESVIIGRVEPGKLINSKTEWNHINIPHTSVVV